MTIDWDDPEQRLALIERVGVDEYNKQMLAHLERSMGATIDRHAIRHVLALFDLVDVVPMAIDWDDPEQRLAIERVGGDEYKLMLAHLERSTVATINGHAIRPVMTRFGLLFMVEGTDKAFSTLREAEVYGATLPEGTL
jgi:hypothetical protein